MNGASELEKQLTLSPVPKKGWSAVALSALDYLESRCRLFAVFLLAVFSSFCRAFGALALGNGLWKTPNNTRIGIRSAIWRHNASRQCH